MKQEVEELKEEITRLKNVIADLEMKISSQNVSSPKEEITTVQSVPSLQACSEEELMKYTEHKFDYRKIL